MLISAISLVNLTWRLKVIDTQDGEQCVNHDGPIDSTTGIGHEENMDDNAVLASFSDRDNRVGSGLG